MMLDNQKKIKYDAGDPTLGYAANQLQSSLILIMTMMETTSDDDGQSQGTSCL